MEVIRFKEKVITVVADPKGKRWVSVRHVCEVLGVAYNSQYTKLRRLLEFTCYDIITTGVDGKQYSMFCIAAEHTHLWIAGISSSKISPEIRDQFIIYKHECANVIYNYFNRKGEDFLGIAQQLQEFRAELNQKIDNITGVADTVFGDDKEAIQELVKAVAKKYSVDGRTVWGWVQTECDISSYKKQNLKVINFLRNKLGAGVFGVVKETPTDSSQHAT